MTILCLASYEKGHEFLRECKRQGCSVVLVTAESLRHTAHWPHDSIDEIFYLPDDRHRWNLAHLRNAVSYLARTRVFDRVVALDDFDVEVAAMLREREGRDTEAIDLYRDAVRGRDGSLAVASQSLLRMASLMNRVDRKDEAREALVLAHTLDPSSEEIARALAADDGG